MAARVFRRHDVEEWVDGIVLAAGVAIDASIRPGIWGDGAERFAALRDLLEHGTLHSPRYSMVMPIFASPLWWLGRALGNPEAVTAYANMILFAVLLVGLGWSLVGVLPGRQIRTCLILLVYASMFPNHLRSFYGEVFTAVSVGLGIVWLSRSGRGVAGYAAIGLGAINTPAALVGVAAVAARQARRVRLWLPLLLPLVVWLAVHVEAWVARGGFWTSGYEHDAGFKTVLPYSGLPGFSYPWILGVLAILVSFGKGLLFFVPGLFVWPPRAASDRARWIHATSIAFVAGLIVVYAKWWSWYGGWFWGPRFFLFACIPASLALAMRSTPDAGAHPAAHAAVAVAIVLSFWVGLCGATFDQRGLDVCSQNRYALESLCHFVPDMSPLWRPFVDFDGIVAPADRAATLAKCVWWMAVGLWVARSPIAAAARALASHAAALVKGSSERRPS